MRRFSNRTRSCWVVKTRHGYTLLYWEPRRKEYVRATLCRTPKALLDALLKNYAEFAEDKLTGMDRELTAEEARAFARIASGCACNAKTGELKQRQRGNHASSVFMLRIACAVAVITRMLLSFILSSRASSCRRWVDLSADLSGKKN